MNSEMDADMQETRSLPLNEEIKVEPSDPVDTLAQAMVVPKVEDVKTERLSCNFGIKCFRRNAVHRTEMAHPGDADYRRPNFPNAPAGTPMCPWGAACYRRNPQHFINLSHPPATASSTTTVPQANHMPYRTRNNNRNNQRVDSRLGDSNDLDSNDSDFEDPFIDNGSSDEYIPNEDEDDDIEDS
ncbi:Aprataxin and PNK-like factor, partial [Pseudolycoriella hygida]